MDEQNLLLGPVLSFRGVGESDTWRVTALLGLKAKTPTPTFQVDGKICPPPKELLALEGERYLRYDLSCKMRKNERTVSYGIPDGLTWRLTVPGKGCAPRMAYVSCNGFSDPKLIKDAVPSRNKVWEDLLYSHDRALRKAPGEPPSKDIKQLDKEQLWHETRIHDQGLQRFHLLLMGGDQIYFDSIWHAIDPLWQWVDLSRQEQLAFTVSPALEAEIAAYYFKQYKERWLRAGRPAWSSATPTLDAGAAMASIPSLMMWDDHDIFDGWGSYSTEMQACELFQTLFRHARRAFWVFQMQQALADLPELEDATPAGFSRQDPLFKPIAWKKRLGHDALALPLLDAQPGFSSVYTIGPIAIVAADLRTERSRTQVMGEASWQALKAWLGTLPAAGQGPQTQPGCQHLLFMSSVPVIHPKLSMAELLVDTFGQDHVIDSSADDLKDHWSHDDHAGERKRLLEVLSSLACDQQIRVSLVSGDVHVAAWGMAYRKDLPATQTWSQIHQFTSSGVVHPPPQGWKEWLFLAYLNAGAKHAQRIGAQFVAETLDFPNQHTRIMAARNWLALELNPEPGKAGELWATWRCETKRSFSNHVTTVPAIAQTHAK